MTWEGETSLSVSTSNCNPKPIIYIYKHVNIKLEDLKVLRRSPDLLNKVKIGQGQLQLIMEQILFYHICCRHFGQVT